MQKYYIEELQTDYNSKFTTPFLVLLCTTTAGRPTDLYHLGLISFAMSQIKKFRFEDFYGIFLSGITGAAAAAAPLSGCSLMHVHRPIWNRSTQPGRQRWTAKSINLIAFAWKDRLNIRVPKKMQYGNMTSCKETLEEGTASVWSHIDYVVPWIAKRIITLINWGLSTEELIIMTWTLTAASLPLAGCVSRWAFGHLVMCLLFIWLHLYFCYTRTTDLIPYAAALILSRGMQSHRFTVPSPAAINKPR